MNTTLRKHKTKLRYERKELTMILIQADNQKNLGYAKINLSNYIKCEKRTKFSQELLESPYPEATIEFSVTAS